MPKRKVSSAQGGSEKEPRQRLARLSAKFAPIIVETNPKEAARKDKSSDKKVQTEGKRGAKGKQARVADQDTKDLPAENEKSPDQCGSGSWASSCKSKHQFDSRPGHMPGL